MIKRMYSFRLNKSLMDKAKGIAKGMDVSLSFFITCLVKEKIKKRNRIFLATEEDRIKFLHEIVTEIKNLRTDLKSLLKSKK